MPGYRWVDHTAELELRVEGDTEEEIFCQALAALAALVRDGTAHDTEAVAIELHAHDRATLLADWLEELVVRAETEDLVPEGVAALELHEDGLHAEVHAHRGRPRHLVTGVSYHRLSFDAVDDGYRATVILDV